MTERKAPVGFIGSRDGALDTTWQTPPALVARVARYFGGTIPHDVCTTPANPCGAQTFWTAEDDALSRERWPARWWCNPPYGRALTSGGWLERLACAPGSEGVILLSCARWEQHQMQQLLAVTEAVCFVRKRIDFVRAETGEPVSGNTYASMFLGVGDAWGALDGGLDCRAWERWRAAFSDVGVCLRLGPSTTPPRDGIKLPRAKRPRRAT